ncbi:phage minor structural protein GP20 [Megasphaera cerevisiae DSM 20462]|uniref:Phage minor structural protein GP20 n=1 Tax=Megasphaera cerevisiae DSM 20462 TaxID=1122219 RepID=A0A0J6WUK7_9FIRM|nr:phage scaffolding protein [Megasphaera cerevisiae]KMO87220.1 phage minor structural protein GP20 [Megasphaera cerevisiae DSM 20462]SJZ60964.1 Phage minor structural protein GP20 [Megasphaera cerevisiae DSM 20462]
MTIEEFVAQKLGIAEDQRPAAVTALKGYLDGEYVTKSRFNEVNEEKKTLTGQIADRDKQLDTLKNSKGDMESLKKQIKQLQDTNAVQKTEAETKMKELQFTNAIKLAIADKAQDVDIVSGLFDKEKLILGQDGKVTGLDEQLKALVESKPFLFKNDGKPPKYDPAGGSGGAGKNPFAKDSFNLTEQGKLLKENPEQARSLAAAAGVTI